MVFGRLFKKERPAPPVVETDEVVPVHLFDDLPGYRKTLLTWTFQFNDVLDADKLHDALRGLIEKGDGWGKLGGRLRLNGQGKLEIHIPRPFTADRPPVRYVHKTIDSAVSDHPLASQLPKPDTDGKPKTYPGALTFAPLGVPDDGPKTLEDFIYSDEPQLTLYIVSFADATLVNLLYLHTLTDEMGLVTLMKAWASVLAGNDNVPRVIGLKEDPMDAFRTGKSTETHVLADKQIKGFSLVLWVLKFAMEIRKRPKLETRNICIPPRTMESMRKAAVGHISSTEANVVTLTDGDILSAWLSQMMVKSEAKKADRTATIRIPIDTRKLTPDVFHEGTACIQNAILLAYLLTKVSQLLEAPLGQTALKFRKCIEEQSTRPQFDALGHLAIESLAKTNSAPIMGDTSMFLISVADWDETEYFRQIDFSPAVVKSGSGSQSGHVIYYHSRGLIDTYFSSPIFTIAGKDSGGYTWVRGDLTPDTWPIVEKSLAEYAAL